MREAKSTEQEEVEERIFCIKCGPQKLMFHNNKQCIEKSLSYWQLASVVIDEGEESDTTNLCKKCLNNSLKAKRIKNH